MNCPVCQQSLVRTRYAGANLHRCEKCSGHLVDQRRTDTIKKRIDKNPKRLAQEVREAGGEDAIDQLRCPRCLARMKKRLLDDLSFHVDECPNCRTSWFDGGELAKVQLAFEARAQTQELNQMRDRLQSMTAAERQAHEDRITGLGELGTPLQEAVTEIALDLFLRSILQGL